MTPRELTALLSWFGGDEFATVLGQLYLQTYDNDNTTVVTNGRIEYNNGHDHDEGSVQEENGVEVTLSSVENGGGSIVSSVALETPIEFQKVDSINSKSSNKTNSTASTSGSDDDNNSLIAHGKKKKKLSLPQRYARSIAANPEKHLVIAMGVTLFFTTFLITVTLARQAFEIDVRLGPWLTRNTLIANRAMQSFIHLGQYANLFGLAARIPGTNYTWNDIPSDEKPADLDYRTVPYSKESNVGYHDTPSYDLVCNGEWYDSGYLFHPNQMNLMGVFKTVDASTATNEHKDGQVEGGGEDSSSSSSRRTALEAGALYDMCKEEEHVLKQLEAHDLCYKCDINSDVEVVEQRCIQPFSLVASARLYLKFLATYSLEFSTDLYLTPSMTCSDLRDGWTPTVQDGYTKILQDCTNRLLEERGLKEVPTSGTYTNCMLPSPEVAAPLVDLDFATTGIVSYTTSTYATRHDFESLDKMYELDQAGAFNLPDYSTVATTKEESETATPPPPLEQGIYELGVKPFFVHGDRALVDHRHHALGGFYLKNVFEILPSEVLLGFFACVVCSICVMLHTKSIFLTFFGLCQIMLALPVTWGIYYFGSGFNSFPVCNIISIFIVFALGADDIFVVVDHWKNTRRQLPPDATTEEVALVALPAAAYATFVTSITTSVAFFSSAVINITSVALFGIFCGTLIAVDYILCVLLLSPVLCLYDDWVHVKKTTHWLLTIDRKLRKSNSEARKETGFSNDQEEGDIVSINTSSSDKVESGNMSKPSLIHRVFEGYFYVLHKLRWVLLLGSIGAIIGCSFVARQLKPPDTDPRPSFLLPDSRYELHSTYTSNLVAHDVITTESPKDKVQVVFGLLPVDNGYYLDSTQPGSIVYDEDFDPAGSQLYLLDMCDRVFSDGLVKKPSSDYNCSMQEFDTWLSEESQLASPSNEYTQMCNGATSIPVPEDMFHQCLIAFSDLTNSSEVSHHNGRVKTIVINSLPVRESFTIPNVEQGWLALESWSDIERKFAPTGANNWFVSSFTYWFYDTFDNMISSTYKSALISMCAAALMILSTSLSGTLMLFSTISILYILVAVTASLVGLGWTLGLFESVLFAITIGLGADFVLHLSHAYSMLPGEVCRKTRTYHALMHIGPSIMGSAATTLSTALIMLFSQLTFTKKFATLLIMTISHSLIGSCIIFLAWCLCFGPSQSCIKQSCVKSKNSKKIPHPLQHKP